VRITLVSRDPFLTIRPRLYEADLDGVRVPLDGVLADDGVERVEGEVVEIDPRMRAVVVDGAAGRRVLSYDRLILAAGSKLRRPDDVPGAAEHAFAVDTYDEAAALERHLAALPGRPARAGRFTAVVAGASFTGLEVGTELVARLRASAARAGASSDAGVVLVERADAVGAELGPNPRPLIERALRELGVRTRVGGTVAEVREDGVLLGDGEWIPAATTVWAAGLRASALTAQLPVERDALGRLSVDAYLRVRWVDGVLAAGAVARAMADAEDVAPMSCQYAIPMGDVAGRNAVAELSGVAPAAFSPADYVTCLDLGAWGALFTQGWERRVTLTGYWAKAMKETINRRLIYPPTRARRAELLRTPELAPMPAPTPAPTAALAPILAA
jgi:NADH dehydrogenase